MIRKIIISWVAATSLILFSTQAFALLNFSVGVPLSHTFTGKYDGGDEVKSDGVSGTFVQIGVPILPGIGMDSYKTKIKQDPGSAKIDLETTIYNLYYLLPIPVINITLGAGVGSTELKCPSCAAWFDKSSATQVYASLGFPIIPLFDLHLSYRSVSSKAKGKGANEGNDVDLGGNVMGLGIGFNF